MKFKFFILISLFFSLLTQATLSINDSHSKLNFYPESNEINANSENILTIEISMDKVGILIGSIQGTQVILLSLNGNFLRDFK